MSATSEKQEIIEFNRRQMQWSHKRPEGVALRTDYPDSVKQFNGEIGFYETSLGEIIRVFEMQRGKNRKGGGEPGRHAGAKSAESITGRLAAI